MSGNGGRTEATGVFNTGVTGGNGGNGKRPIPFTPFHSYPRVKILVIPVPSVIPV